MALQLLTGFLVRQGEKSWMPDIVVRAGIRRLLTIRLQSLARIGVERSSELFRSFQEEAGHGPLAHVPQKANEQHYELPADFFRLVLGSHLKYSSGYFLNPNDHLNKAEETALRLTCEHAELSDGQRILELGCGWGSLSLFMARQFPNSRILAVSNSHSQRHFIQNEIQKFGLGNLEVRTCDINDLSLTETFDRVVSVEMFEHVRNHAGLMERISRWLTPNGKLFVHIFCHNRFTYAFEDDGPSSWMARHFFSGGVMPGRDLLMQCQQHLALQQRWDWDGRHYQRTCNLWLSRMDDHDEEVNSILKQTYGNDWLLWKQRWRIFFMSCAELFGFNNGQEWHVSHYLFHKNRLRFESSDSVNQKVNNSSSSASDADESLV